MYPTQYATSGLTLAQQATYGFDSDSRLTSLDEWGYGGYGGGYGNASTFEIEQYSLQYDADSRIYNLTNAVHSSENEGFQYDADSQLASTSSYGGYGGYGGSADQISGTNYDPNGNPTGTGVVIGAGNRLLSDGTFNYAYDNDGRMISKTNISSQQTTSYAYDPIGRLIGAVVTNASEQLVSSVAYTYDMNGSLTGRVAKTHSNGTVSSTITPRFVVDPTTGNLLLAFDGNSNLVNRFLDGPAVDQILAQENVGFGSADRALWMLTDWEGSVVDVTSPLASSSNGVVDHLTYNSFGQISSQTNAPYAPIIGYTGAYTDPTTGLQLHDNRWYDPIAQRWITQDPTGLGPDSNPYRYCGNDPVNNTDPTGLWRTPSPSPSDVPPDAPEPQQHPVGRFLEKVQRDSTRFDWQGTFPGSGKRDRSAFGCLGMRQMPPSFQYRTCPAFSLTPCRSGAARTAKPARAHGTPRRAFPTAASRLRIAKRAPFPQT